MAREMRGKGKPLAKLLALLVLSVGFSNNPIAQGIETVDYFPLNVGDSYSYRNAYPCPPDAVRERYYTLLSSTIDTVRIQGKKYFVKDRFFLSPDTLRIDDQGNVVIWNLGEDKIFYKLNAAVGDTWSFSLGYPPNPPTYTVTLQSRRDSITVHAGRFRRCLRFLIGPGPEAVTEWLAPHVGLVFICAMEPHELYEAQVKAVNYPLVTSVEQNESNPIREFVLYQNYPNPFNPSTVISYQLPTGGYVTLKLYNTLGQEVATLVDGIQDTGFKSVMFDASRLPSGVYFYRLQAGEFIQNKKMLVVK
jgi:hypothetical protein